MAVGMDCLTMAQGGLEVVAVNFSHATIWHMAYGTAMTHIASYQCHMMPNSGTVGAFDPPMHDATIVWGSLLWYKIHYYLEYHNDSLLTDLKYS